MGSHKDPNGVIHSPLAEAVRNSGHPPPPPAPPKLDFGFHAPATRDSDKVGLMLKKPQGDGSQTQLAPLLPPKKTYSASKA